MVGTLFCISGAHMNQAVSDTESRTSIIKHKCRFTLYIHLSIAMKVILPSNCRVVKHRVCDAFRAFDLMELLN